LDRDWDMRSSIAVRLHFANLLEKDHASFDIEILCNWMLKILRLTKRAVILPTREEAEKKSGSMWGFQRLEGDSLYSFTWVSWKKQQVESKTLEWR
jgi:hypothetical protein